MHADISVSGIVQGVGFRPFVYRTAVHFGLKGYVRNRADAIVEIHVEGEKAQIESFLFSLKTSHPPLARLDSFHVDYSDSDHKFSDFTIQTSSTERAASGSVIPPDIAICDDCLHELHSLDNRRRHYFFITCTNCGPRFTTITAVPYDRPNTMMRQFPMCTDCHIEYTNPLDRRFHAQTIACQICGPKVTLLDAHGDVIETEDAILLASKLLVEGKILAIKGNGGFHLSAFATKDEPIQRLRRNKERRRKPFAIMARDLVSVNEFAEINDHEQKILQSYIRPIVLLRKRNPFCLSNQISPELDTVGTMLPYSGLHCLIFDNATLSALVMTSANAPSQPIITDNDDAVYKLAETVDYFLVHDRDIAQRADDSVLRYIDRSPVLIRRSRGYTPEPILLPDPVRTRAIGFGAELNVTSCMILGNHAFLTQHIGDTETIETSRFLDDAIEHLSRLIGFTPEVIACDLHPKFATTKIASARSERLGVPLRRIQHHHAHVGSLMAEHGLTEIVGIVCDGFGLGADGTAWGGEILDCYQKEFKRAAHLEQQPMIGGDLATRFPVRMVAGILRKEPAISEWLEAHASQLPHGRDEVQTILRQLEKGEYIWTSSCGRVLDAVGAILDLSFERSYEGEPAMRLEATASGGRDRLQLEPQLDLPTIGTTKLVQCIYDSIPRYSQADLAYSAQNYLAHSLAEAAIRIAEESGVKTIGFSGGVALNEHIATSIRKSISRAGLDFVSNIAVPPGDGGISLGQAYLASFD
jgi:hydrogenase maturation protein HypF